jgi:hypothetical protein
MLVVAISAFEFTVTYGTMNFRFLHTFALALACSLTVCASFLFVFPSTVSAQTAPEGFVAKSDGRAITVEWRVTNEVGVALYDIERSPVNHNDFKKIGTLTARGGSQTYRFVDDNAIAANLNGSGNAGVQAGTVYVYRLKIVDANDGITYSTSISVTHTISSVRRTWGMIKEMFR